MVLTVVSVGGYKAYAAATGDCCAPGAPFPWFYAVCANDVRAIERRRGVVAPDRATADIPSHEESAEDHLQLDELSGRRGPVAVGRSTAPWALIVLPIVFFAERRGLGASTGVRRGLSVGLVTLLVPMSLLRPCCDPAMVELAARTGDLSCCTDWSCCAVVGMLMGVLASFALPRVRP